MVSMFELDVDERAHYGAFSHALSTQGNSRYYLCRIFACSYECREDDEKSLFVIFREIGRKMELLNMKEEKWPLSE